MNRVALWCAVVLAGSICAGAVADEKVNPTRTDPVVGSWQGILPNGMGGEIRVVLKVKSAPEGGLSATMDSPDQNASDIPVASITVDAGKVALDVAAVRGSYEGKLDPEKLEISGTWKQSGQTLPLVFKKQPAGN
jgi:hypothetical protein